MGKMPCQSPLGFRCLISQVIEEEPKVDLRGILDQKKKKRECREAFGSRAQLRCAQVQLLNWASWLSIMMVRGA